MEYRPDLQTIVFPNGRTAYLLEVYPTVSYLDVGAWLQLPPLRFSIALHLGALQMNESQQEAMRYLLCNSLIRFAEDNQALVADGGTDAGVMAIMGQAYEEARATFPLVGVTVKNSVTYPGGLEPTPDRWALNEGHTHFVIVDANDFGAESQLLVGMAQISGPNGLAIVINGGAIVQREIEMHAKLGTPVIVLKGTGRYADALATAEPDSELRQPFIEGAFLEVFDVDEQPPEDLYHLIRSALLR